MFNVYVGQRILRRNLHGIKVSSVERILSDLWPCIGHLRTYVATE